MKAYLDNAATTKMDEEVIELMHQMMQNNYGNPSSIHEMGRKSRVIVEHARTTISKLLKVSPNEIFFTSGGTESINSIISGLLQNPDIKRIITSPTEHSSMLRSIEHHAKINGKEVIILNVDKFGHVDIAQLKEVLSQFEDIAVVSLMHGNNEIGTLLHLKKVGEICRKHQSLFVSDMVQTMGKYANDLSSGMLDFAMGSAHKFHGPKGVGFMYINGNNKILPFILGGSQERNMRAGTENMTLIAGMAKAMEIAYANMEVNSQRLAELKNYLVQKIESDFPHLEINGDPQGGLYNLLSIAVPKTIHNQLLLMKFDILGVFLSGGSACSSGVIKDSHVITAIGKVKNYRPIRLSMSKFTTKEEIDYFLEVLKKV